MLRRTSLVAFVLGLVLPGILVVSGDVFAQSEIERLQEEIAERNDRLSDIDAEIAKWGNNSLTVSC